MGGGCWDDDELWEDVFFGDDNLFLDAKASCVLVLRPGTAPSFASDPAGPSKDISSSEEKSGFFQRSGDGEGARSAGDRGGDDND